MAGEGPPANRTKVTAVDSASAPKHPRRSAAQRPFAMPDGHGAAADPTTRRPYQSVTRWVLIHPRNLERAWPRPLTCASLPLACRQCPCNVRQDPTGCGLSPCWPGPVPRPPQPEHRRHELRRPRPSDYSPGDPAAVHPRRLGMAARRGAAPRALPRGERPGSLSAVPADRHRGAGHRPAHHDHHHHGGAGADPRHGRGRGGRDRVLASRCAASRSRTSRSRANSRTR